MDNEDRFKLYNSKYYKDYDEQKKIKLSYCKYSYEECFSNIELIDLDLEYLTGYQKYYYDIWRVSKHKNMYGKTIIDGELKCSIWAKDRFYFIEILEYWNYIDGPKRITYSEYNPNCKIDKCNTKLTRYIDD